MSDKRAEVAERMRRVRAEVRSRSLLGEADPAGPSGAPSVSRDRPLPAPESPLPKPPPEPPDAAPVNQAWETQPGVKRKGVQGVLFRLFDRVLSPRFQVQQVFNARQVQLDNDLLDYLAKRLAATHRHYDEVLGIYGRHLGEIDTRHMMLQEEVIAHVEDLTQRLDLTLAASERSRVSLERELREQRRRVEELEARLREGDLPKR